MKGNSSMKPTQLLRKEKLKNDLTIIGGGSAGLVLAVAGAKLGKKTALVEKHRIGGDCLWTGVCLPRHSSRQRKLQITSGTLRNTALQAPIQRLTGNV